MKKNGQSAALANADVQMIISSSEADPAFLNKEQRAEMTPVKSFQDIANPVQRLGDTLTSTTPGLFNPQQKLPKGKLYSREDIAANIAQIKATVSLDKVNKALIESQKQMVQQRN